MKKVGAITIDNASISEALRSNAEGSNYVGLGDNMLDFGSGSAKSFIEEDKTGRSFQIKLTSTGSEAVSIAINPASHTSAVDIKDGNGVSVDAILVDGSVISVGTTKVVTAQSTPRKIALIHGYAAQAPMRIMEIGVKVDDADQLDEEILIRKETPFGGSEDDRRVPSDYQASADNNDKLVKIDDVQGWLFDGSHVIITKLRPGRTLTLTFKIGAVLDLSTALNAKALEAKNNVVRAYATQGK